MPRRRNPEQPSRARQRPSIAPVFVRRPDLAAITGLTEGYIRQQEGKGVAPPPIRLENSRVVVYELQPWLEWLRRNASHAA